MNKLLISIVIWGTCQASFSQESLDNHSYNDFSWEEEALFGQELPMVLTASRLKQPKAEVPASVTIITAEKIKLWGARSLPELMKFIPGMFVGHGDDENNASVAYHAANPSIMRRLQVLVDGRSVYKAAIANVVWDDIPLAIEDIDRIEVTRGPNAATYGANSYSGVINILTRHPGDSLGTKVSALRGNKGQQDLYMSHGFNINDTSVRLSVGNKVDEGFDGNAAESGEDALRDGHRYAFFTAALAYDIDPSTNLELQLGYKDGKVEMRKSSDLFLTSPDKENSNSYVWGRWQHDFNQNHKVSMQGYVQTDSTKQEFIACAPTLSFDSNVRDIYRSNPDWADVVALSMPAYGSDADVTSVVDAILADAISADDLSIGISSLREHQVIITNEEIALAKQALQNVPNISNDIGEIICGRGNTSISEQRIDLEWQDTMRWSDQLRTVGGLSYRQDSANSNTFFKGRVDNEAWRAFINAEYKIRPSLILNAGAMYEYETHNQEAFSPRVALNILLAPQQSIRFVISQALRSPDFLESQPDYSITLKSLFNTDGSDNNYLNLSQADFYMEQDEDDEKHLKQEEITSYEIGYYHAINSQVELDIKVFHEELTDLISEPITLDSRGISNDNEMNIDGAELQISGHLNLNHSYWLAYSYIDTDVDYSGEIVGGGSTAYEIETSERLLSSENSTAASWIYNSEHWRVSVSYFNQDTRHQREKVKPYERWQVKIIKPFNIAGLDAEVSYYVQHNRQPDIPLNYKHQKYSSPNIYYAKLSFEF